MSVWRNGRRWRGTSMTGSYRPSKAGNWLRMMRWIPPPIPSECVGPWNSCQCGLEEPRKKVGQRRILCGRRPQTNDLAEAFRRVTEDGVIPSSMAVTFSAIGDGREEHPLARAEAFRLLYPAFPDTSQ